MGPHLSRGASRRASAHDKATLRVKLLRDTAKTYLRKVEQSLQYEQDLAVQLIQRGLRERAKCIVRKQLVLKEHLKMTDRQLEALEATVNALETAGLNARVFEGLKAGHLALKRANEVLNIKNVELILEETVQAIEKQEEINKMVNDLGLCRSEEVIDSDLDRELENLIEKSGSAVVLSSSAAEDKKESEDHFKSQKDKSWKEVLFKRSDSNRISSLDITKPPKPSTSSPPEKAKKKKKKKKSTPPLPLQPKERGITILN